MRPLQHSFSPQYIYFCSVEFDKVNEIWFWLIVNLGFRMYSFCVLFYHSEMWQCTDFNCSFWMPFSIQYIVRAINIKRTDRDAQPKVNVTTMTIYFYPWRARVAHCWVVRATRLPPVWPRFKSGHLSDICRLSLLLVLSLAVRDFFFMCLSFPLSSKTKLQIPIPPGMWMCCL